MGGRGFRRGLGVALAGVMALSAVPAFAADEAPRLVKVTAPTDEMIHELEESYDVGYLADHTEAAVYVTDTEEAELRALGYTIGDTVEDESTWEARKAEIAATKAAEAAAAEFAEDGVVQVGARRGAAARRDRRDARVHVHQLRGSLPVRGSAQQGQHDDRRPDAGPVVRGPRRRVPARGEHGQVRRRRRVHVPPPARLAARRVREHRRQGRDGPRRGRDRRDGHDEADRVDRLGAAPADRDVPEGLHHEVHGSDRGLRADRQDRRGLPGDLRDGRAAERHAGLPAPGDGDAGRHDGGQRQPGDGGPGLRRAAVLEGDGPPRRQRHHGRVRGRSARLRRCR